MAGLALVLAAGGCGIGIGLGGQDATWHAAGTPTSLAPTAPTGTPAGTSTAAARQLTIVGSGDVLLHPDLWAQARRDAQQAGEAGYDFRPILAGVRDVISSADLAICHMETPLAPVGGPFVGFPRFSVPPQIADSLADLGYDTCSTASNHTIDQGEAGVRRTLDTLDAAGIKHAGSYRSQAAHDTVNMIDVRGVKVAQLSYTFGFNGLSRPAGKEWLANLTDEEAIRAEARRARAQGAAIVVVSLHWGTEYQHSPNADQLALADHLLDSPDIDLILGCHAHVVQPIAKVHGKWVVYSMGNEIAHHADPINDNREGVLPRFTFTEVKPGQWRVTRAEAIPVWMALAPQNRLVNLPAALASADTSASQRRIYQAAYDRISRYLDSLNGAKDGLVIVER